MRADGLDELSGKATYRFACPACCDPNISRTRAAVVSDIMRALIRELEG